MISEVGLERGIGISTSGRMAFQDGVRQEQKAPSAQVFDRWSAVTGVVGAEEPEMRLESQVAKERMWSHPPKRKNVFKRMSW